MEPLWYFGYGSNMSRAIFLELRQMRPLDVRPGFLDGHRLCFNIPVGPGERGVANLEAHPGARTWGVLYHLTTADFDRLDTTEGVGFGLYRRLAVDVVATTNERVAAFTYQSSVVSDGRKPSPRYIGLLLDGAREQALPAEYVTFLQSFELAEDERQPGQI
jgi:cation transport regulator ChaC